MKKILVLYYSMYGHIETMAQAVVEGAKSVDGVEVTLKHGCKIPTAHTCTKQLNLPRYNSKVTVL